MWFIGVEIEQETSAPPPKINPWFAPALHEFPWVEMTEFLGTELKFRKEEENICYSLLYVPHKTSHKRNHVVSYVVTENVCRRRKLHEDMLQCFGQ